MDVINANATSRRRNPRRSVIEAVAGVASFGLILACLVYAFTWTGDAQVDAAAPTEPSATPTEPGPAEPTDVETDDEPTSEVGETRVGTNADVTLLQAKKVLPPDDRAAEPGEEWFGIRAQLCMNDDAASPSGELPWSSWTVKDAKGNAYPGRPAPWDDYPAQQLPTTPIQPGDCSLGWALVGVPEGASQRIVTVEFGTNDPAVWVI